MPKLRPVPEAAPRALGLIRVSTERTEMISPELQRTAIEDHAARRGYRITKWIEGLDESGSQRRSKWWAKLDEAVGLVESNDADVIVVWRFSRTARQRLKWAVAIDRVEVAGGLLESATEPLDTSTASGRLARGMLAEFAAYEAEAIGNTWREVHARRTSRGLPANGKPRFGYRNVDGIHAPDPETGPVLAALYRRYVAGETLYGLTTWLNQEGVRTVAGYSAKGPGEWSMSGLRKMLDSGFGAGLIMVGGERHPGAHKPVIGEDTWTAYLAAREGRRHLKRTERSPFVLSGLVWCGCGGKMGGARKTSQHGRVTPYLKCMVATQPGAERHPGSYVKMAPVEEYVRGWVAKLATAANRSVNAELATRARATVRRQDAKSLERKLIEVDRAIGKLTADVARGLVPEAAYPFALAELTHERDQLEARRLTAAADAIAGDPARIAADLTANWDVYDLEHRRAALRRLVGRVVVTNGITVTVDPAWAPGGKRS